MGYNPQESLENTINTMGTLLGVHPIVPWNCLPYYLFLQTYQIKYGRYMVYGVPEIVYLTPTSDIAFIIFFF